VASPSPSPAAAKPSAAAAVPTLPVPTVSDQARQDAQTFFSGKTVRVIVGLSPGGGYDIMARLVAKHLPKHIPGNPTVVVENQAGAAGALAANTVFNTSPKDGSVVLAFSETLLQAQVLGGQGINFDARKFSWLGSTQTQTAVCAARTDSGITTFQDIVGGGKKLIVGSTAPGSNTNDFPAVLAGVLGANIQIVPGFAGTNEIRLAMERNENNGACITWESFKVTSADWFSGSNRFASILVQQAPEKNPDLASVPLAEELAQNANQKAIIRAATGSLAISKPFVLPPGVAEDRLTVMRAAFAETMNDLDLRQEAAQAKIDLYPRTGEAAAKIAEDALAVPPEVVPELKRILGS
jgi:tripartite-type tricarboxylate transporter receptor subunit TctC